MYKRPLILYFVGVFGSLKYQTTLLKRYIRNGELIKVIEINLSLKYRVANLSRNLMLFDSMKQTRNWIITIKENI